MLSFLVTDLMSYRAKQHRRITQKEYDDWKAEFIFEALRNREFGENFCDFFKIYDNILLYESSIESADQYIQKVYIKK